MFIINYPKCVYQKLPPFIKSSILLLSCTPIAIGSIKLMPVLHDRYQATKCISSTQTLSCASYAVAQVALGITALIAMSGLFAATKLTISRYSKPPNTTQTNIFFRSQQNGGFARYAEDDLQGTHRRPLGEYDPVRWEGGSQSI